MSGRLGGREAWAAPVRWRPTVAEVDLDAIRHNVRSLAPPGAAVMAIVKADGYGHGDVEVARAALDSGAAWLGVALVEEGVRLRDAGIEAPILVLTEFPRGSESEALGAGLTPTLYTDEGLARLAAAARSLGRSPGVHVKVDTGMHRVGLGPERAPSFCRETVEEGLAVEGLWTHFAVSEELDHPFNDQQLDRFRAVVVAVRDAGVEPAYLHAANTGAIMGRPDTHLDLVRLGIGMYGIAPGADLSGGCDLRPAMSWRSAVILAKRVRAGEGISYGLHYRLERDSTIATIPVGYADGYPRALSSVGDVLIRGRRCRVAGSVTMDQLMADCGDEPVEAGDEVVLIGRQGEEEIGAGELASRIGTIPYEIVCGVSERVPREYRGA